MNLRGIEAIEKTTQQTIKQYAKLHGLSEAEATNKYFSEHPESYKLYNEAHNDRVRLGKARQAQKEDKPVLAMPAYSEAAMAAAKRLMGENPGLSVTDALTSVFSESRELREGYARESRHPKRASVL